MNLNMGMIESRLFSIHLTGVSISHNFLILSNLENEVLATAGAYRPRDDLESVILFFFLIQSNIY